MRLREEFKPQETIVEEVVEETQEVAASNADNTAPAVSSPNISLDISMSKSLVILVMFAVMFALPIFIFNNRDRLFNRTINNSYTQTSISYDDNELSGNGSVAGTSDEASVLGISTENLTNNSASVNIGTAFIVLGIGFLLLPVYFLISKR